MQQYKRFSKKFPQTKQNEPLAKHTTFKVGGPADLFLEAQTTDEIVTAVNLARQLKIPYRIIGVGGNILAADEGFRGLIIKNEADKFTISGNKIITDSGVLVGKLVLKAAKKGLDLTFLAGFPSTVGGATYGNAGKPGKSIGDVLESAKIINSTGQVGDTRKEYFDFSYRHSMIKETGEIILEITLVLETGKPDELVKKIRAQQVLRKVKNLPGGAAGSVFKNVKKELLEGDFRSEFKDFVPAGWLIERAGGEGQKTGGAYVWEGHCNVIINSGTATASDIKKLIEILKNKVKNKFGVTLEEEIQYLGF